MPEFTGTLKSLDGRVLADPVRGEYGPRRGLVDGGYFHCEPETPLAVASAFPGEAVLTIPGVTELWVRLIRQHPALPLAFRFEATGKERRLDGSNFDASALQAALDQTEMAGVPTHLVEQLRELVRERAGPIRLARPHSGRATRSIFGDRLEVEWNDGSSAVGLSPLFIPLEDGADYLIKVGGREFVFRSAVPR